MPRMNIKRTCKNRFLRCPTSENSLCGFGHTSGREPNVKNRVSVMQRLGMGDHPGVLGRSVWRLKSLVCTMDRSPTEYGGQGRLLHTPSTTSNMSNFATDPHTPSQPQILLRLQPATLRKSS